MNNATESTTLTYHGDPALKASCVADADAHRAADRYLRSGEYLVELEDGQWRGCSLGCVVAPLIANDLGVPVKSLIGRDIHWHAEQERALGIPEWLGYVQDRIFESLPESLAQNWTQRFLRAVPVGVDLTPVRDAWFRDVILDPDRGAAAHASRVLDGAGHSESAAAMRGLSRDSSWETVIYVADVATVFATDAASYAATTSISWAAAFSSSVAAPDAESVAAYAAIAVDMDSDPGWWAWASDRLIHHLILSIV